jgi:hypothetical protein
MKKYLIIIALFLVLFSSITVSQNIFFKLDGGIALPMGLMSDSIKMGFGGSLTCGYAFDENVAITLTSGYLSFPGKDISTPLTVSSMKFDIVPVLFGTRYTLPINQDINAYAKLDIGVFIMKGTQTLTIISSNKQGTAVNTETKFGIVPSLGGEYKINDNYAIDLNFCYDYLATEEHATKWLGIYAGLKYTL